MKVWFWLVLGHAPYGLENNTVFRRSCSRPDVQRSRIERLRASHAGCDKHMMYFL